MNAIPAPDEYQDLREAVRALCAKFDSAYWQKIDAARGYPEAFVDELTRAGWLAAMIPAEYGGSGLGLTEASVIMEEINLSGGNAGACHGQMYNMGTVLRHGSEDAEARVSAEHRQRRAAFAVDGGHRADRPAPTRPDSKTTAVRKGDRYVLNGQKVWTSRLQHSDLMIVLARTTPLAEVKRKSDGMSVFLVDLRDGQARRSRRHHRAPDSEHGQPRNQRSVLRRSRDPRGQPDRRGRQGLPLHSRRPECRAHADRRGVHRRRLVVRRQRASLRERAHRVRPADRQEPGGAVSDRRSLHRDSKRRT